MFGYSTLAFLIGKPLKRDLSAGMVFGDFRLHVENSGGIGFNVGGGYRWIDFEGRLGSWHKNRILGLHGGFDGRQYHCQDGMICDKEQFYWVNLGFESLGREWDFRVNGYLGVGRRDREFMLEAIRFTGNTLIVAPFYAEAMWGIDGEFGRRLKRVNRVIKRRLNLDPKIYAAIGGYHFHSRHGEDATGVRFRLQANLHTNVTVGLRTSYDSRFGALILGQVAFSIGNPARSTRSAPDHGPSMAIRRLTEFRQRQELIVVGEGLSNRTRVLTDDAGNPVPFVHVNNTSAAGGDGTFERPYDILTSVEGGGSNPGDTIVVHGGDGTTAGYDQGVTLQTNQTLIGGQLLGMFTFGGQVIWSKIDLGRPTLTNTNVGNVVTVANGNTIQGIDIINATGDASTVPGGDPATGHAIFGDGVDGLVVRDVGLLNNASDGVKILNGQGVFLFDQIVCRGNGAGPPVFGPNTRDCIDIVRSATGELWVTLRDSVITDNVGDGLEISNFPVQNSDPMTILVENTLFARNTESGITIANTGALPTNGRLNLIVRNNTFLDHGYNAVEINSFGFGTDIRIIGNLIDGTGTNLNQGGGARQSGITLLVSSVGGATNNVTISGNVVANALGTGINLWMVPFGGAGTSTFNVDISGNTLIGNGAAFAGDPAAGGILILSFADGADAATLRVNLNVQDNVFTANSAVGLSIYTLGGGGATVPDVCVRLQGNTSDTGFLLDQNGGFLSPALGFVPISPGAGTLSLEPGSGNNVPPTTVGTITSVPAGTCGP